MTVGHAIQHCYQVSITKRPPELHASPCGDSPLNTLKLLQHLALTSWDAIECEEAGFRSLSTGSVASGRVEESEPHPSGWLHGRSTT